MSFNNLPKRISLWILFFLLSATANAQLFSPSYPNPIASGGYSSLFDYDHDGDADLIVSGAVVYNPGLPTHPTILYRNDNGKFIEQPETFNGEYGNIFWIDFDGDGQLDMLLSSSEGSSIFLLSQGKFTQSALYGGGTGPILEFVNPDNDEDVDFLSTYQGLIVYFRNDGIGGLHRAIEMDISNKNINSAEVADYNNDGLLDFLITSATDWVTTVYINQNGSFTATPMTSLPTDANAYTLSLDYDFDGDVDIVYLSSSLVYYENNGGVFTLKNEPFFQGDLIRLTYPENSVKKPILRLVDENGKSIYYQRNLAGNFVQMNGPITSFDFLLSYSTITDNNANEFLNISGGLANGFNMCKVFTYDNGAWNDLYPNAINDKSPYLLKWADVNQDDSKDIFFGNAFNSKLYQKGLSAYAPVYDFHSTDMLSGQWGDLDKDNKNDFTVAFDHQIKSFKGFSIVDSSSTKIYKGFVENDLKIVDFDGDGDNDISIGGAGLLVNVNGTYTQLAFDGDPAHSSTETTDWADFDLDGKLDVAAFGYYYSNFGLTIFKNNGNGFTGSKLSFSAVSAVPYWIDFDGDLYPDLFVTGSSGSSTFIKLFRNHEGKSFVEIPLTGFDIFNGTVLAKIVDVNLDGYQDIVLTGQNQSPYVPKTEIFLNDHGVFKRIENVGIKVQTSAAFDFADIDQDGDLDLLYGGDENVQVYINNAADAFGPVITGLNPMWGTILSFDQPHVFTAMFNEAIVEGSGKVKLVNVASNQVLYQADVSDPAVTISQKQLSVSVPSIASISDGTAVAILMDPGTLLDTKSNPFDGIASNSTWFVTTPPAAKAQQTITFDLQPDILIDDTFLLLKGTTSSGMSVEYTSSDATVAFVSHDTLWLAGTGTTTISAIQAGSEAYFPAPTISHIIDVKNTTPVITGIHNEVDETSLYPNPTDDKAFLKLGSSFNLSEAISIQVCNAQGALVATISTSGQPVIEIDLPGNSSGIFIARVNQNSKSRMIKFVVRH